MNVYENDEWKIISSVLATWLINKTTGDVYAGMVMNLYRCAHGFVVTENPLEVIPIRSGPTNERAMWNIRPVDNPEEVLQKIEDEVNSIRNEIYTTSAVLE